MDNPARLWVGNIGYSVGREEIERRLGAYGKIKELVVSRPKNPNQLHGGFVFVEFREETSAFRCRANIHSAQPDSKGLRWIARTASPKGTR